MSNTSASVDCAENGDPHHRSRPGAWGKFLGDDIGGAVVTIHDAQTGELFQQVTSGLFAGIYQMPSNRTGGAIFYEAIVSARQLSTGNVGTGTFISDPAPTS
jgi:hypothetical protein